MGITKQELLERGEPTEQDEGPTEGEVVGAPAHTQNQTIVTQPEEHTTALTASNNGQISAAELRGMIAYETEIRGIVTEYLLKNMKVGVDFAKIHVVKDCPNKYNCKNEYHFSKPTLLKPGAEKFTSLFKLSAVFKRDDETWEMAGKPAGVFCYICELRSGGGKVLAEGRGACSTSEKNANVNSAVKIAQKRAQVDATLRYGSLSDVFIQDLEDLPAIEQVDPQKTAPQAKPVTTVPAKPVQTTAPTAMAPVKPLPVPSSIVTVPPAPKMTEDEKKKIVEGKREISKLCLAYNPMLVTAADFMTFVKTMTGLDLQHQNYAQIITKLKEKPPSPERQKMVQSMQRAKQGEVVRA